MDPTEITKHIPEVVSVAKVAAASIPFTAIVKRMLGPAADEVAEMWKDQVRLYRYQRQLKCVEKAEKMAQEAGFTPQAVPPKILFPLLEGASFEDNEDLHTMWAALLANAAQQTDFVQPGFVAILKQMSPDEARLLNWICDQTNGDADRSITLSDANAALQVEPTRLGVCFDGLEASQLLRSDRPPSRQSRSGSGSKSFSVTLPLVPTYSVTTRGFWFITVCRPPKSKS